VVHPLFLLLFPLSPYCSRSRIDALALVSPVFISPLVPVSVSTITNNNKGHKNATNTNTNTNANANANEKEDEEETTTSSSSSSYACSCLIIVILSLSLSSAAVWQTLSGGRTQGECVHQTEPHSGSVVPTVSTTTSIASAIRGRHQGHS